LVREGRKNGEEGDGAPISFSFSLPGVAPTCDKIYPCCQ
jgi:hypothetical protein